MSTIHQHTNYTKAGPLLERVASSNRFKELADALRSGRKNIDISGLRGSALAFLVAALQEAMQRTLVVCLPDEEQAEDFLSDLRTISSARAILFPEKEVFPHRLDLKERATLRGERNYCLYQILQGGVDVIVMSLLSFLEKTIPPATLEESKKRIAVNDLIDLGELRQHFVAIGYEAAPFVEEAGQFAVRGSILDIFDPSWEQPARIELIDEKVESLRTFDIDSQRSIAPREELTILPATGVLLDEDFLDKLEKALHEQGVNEKTVAKIKDEIEHNRFSWLLRRYAPALGMNGALLDFFREPPAVVFADAGTLHKSYRELENRMEEMLEKPFDDYPFLDFHSYVNPIDFYERYDLQLIRSWSVRESLGKSQDGRTEQLGHEPIRFITESHPAVLGKLDALMRILSKLRQKMIDIYIYSESRAQCERLSDMLGEHERLVHLPVGWITAGFVWEEVSIAILTDHEIFHRMLPRPDKRVRKKRIQSLSQKHLQLGDFVVHVDFGIGRFTGLEKLVVNGNDTECLTIRYMDGDRIFVPIDQMHLVGKYVGKEGIAPSIDRLGSSRWQKTKEKTKRALEDAARELLDFYAEREVAEGFSFSADTQWQKGLEAAFPYEETPHQLKATEELKRDMESQRPMDRLVCGDVGYGKTEVAIRAAFKAVNDGKQVAVLVPTTILAMQHLKTFRDRMEAYPVKTEMLSRFKSPREQKKIIDEMKSGSVDIVIGTHRLLSEDIAFRDLGLLVIDEEHRFGVKNKEKLKRLMKGVDVVTLTATPIPRTLYMALSGLRHISLIETPPRNRHPVKTEILPFDEGRIAAAIMQEVSRGGQVFFVHNRVASIYSMQAFLEKLIPEVRFGVAHGQMSEKELEKMILAFLDRSFDVLISTMIIESGLDFPNVNTIIINRADRFGLAQLYQLRGRVGRREKQAYAHLFIPRYLTLTDNARKRLQTMGEFEELGSGYRLAMRDLEIRGAGNVLGVEQHGHMAAVGFDMYCKMLREAVEKLKGTTEEMPPPCRIESQLKCFLPGWYVEDQNERMELYRRMAHFTRHDEVDLLEGELLDRFGALPPEGTNLVDLTRLKLLGTALEINRIQLKGLRAAMEFLPGKLFSREQCAALIETFPGRLLFKSGEPFEVICKLYPEQSVTEQVRKLLQIAYDCGTKEICSE